MARDVAPFSSSQGLTPFASPLAPLARLRSEMNHWFDDFPVRLQRLGQRLPITAPAIDMTETDDGYQLSAEVPGIDAKDVQVTVSDGMLRISGEKQEEREEKERDYTYSERSYGRFQREIPLPSDADAAKIQAKVKKGVLKITVPKDKAAEGRSQQIQVEAE